jgi:L-proline amide hydrolase
MLWQGLQTWYRVVEPGQDDTGHRTGAPVVICHGGPGLTHDYLSSAASRLARSGHASVLYDQVGNGRSTRLPQAPAGQWSVQFFLDELAALIDHLGIGGRYHLLGHSWGGMLVLEWARRQPPGLCSAVVVSTFASAADYTAHVAELVAALPPDVRAALDRHEAAGSTDSAEYADAVRVFYRRHVCRCTPVPEEVLHTLAAVRENPAVYQSMAGHSEFRLTGTLRDWDITAELSSVKVPVLILSGRHDEVTPAAVEPLCRGLPDARWVLFEESSHMPHVEEPERFGAVVEEFLSQTESAGPRPLPAGHDHAWATTRTAF